MFFYFKKIFLIATNLNYNFVLLGNDLNERTQNGQVAH